MSPNASEPTQFTVHQLIRISLQAGIMLPFTSQRAPKRAFLKGSSLIPTVALAVSSGPRAKSSDDRRHAGLYRERCLPARTAIPPQGWLQPSGRLHWAIGACVTVDRPLIVLKIGALHLSLYWTQGRYSLYPLPWQTQSKIQTLVSVSPTTMVNLVYNTNNGVSQRPLPW